MTRKLNSIAEVAGDYDAIVLDQWGVLHDGTAPYPAAIQTLDALHMQGHRLAVLSNSGKRAVINAQRIAEKGYAPSLFTTVMTSGEALWKDIASGNITERVFYPVEAAKGDAAAWAKGLPIALTGTLSEAEALLIMGLPDGSDLATWSSLLSDALARKLPCYCSNPDRKSPRAGGLVVSPGALAYAYLEMGAHVTFYGKPHRPVYTAVEQALNSTKLLMVGDSLEHDIAGAQAAGWDSLLITGGIYQQAFDGQDPETVLPRLLKDHNVDPPTYRLDMLQ